MHPKLTRNELVKQLSVTPDAIKQQLARLKKDGLLERIGGSKEGAWKVINE